VEPVFQKTQIPIAKPVRPEPVNEINWPNQINRKDLNPGDFLVSIINTPSKDPISYY
jgi:hypothetical protein